MTITRIPTLGLVAGYIALALSTAACSSTPAANVMGSTSGNPSSTEPDKVAVSPPDSSGVSKPSSGGINSSGTSAIGEPVAVTDASYGSAGGYASTGGATASSRVRAPAMSSISSAYAYPNPQVSYTGAQQEGVWVTAIGQVTLTPDLGVLNLDVQIQDKMVESARDRAAKAMQAVIDALKAQGVAAKDIQTQYFNIQPVYHYEQRTTNGAISSNQVLDGYMVQNQVTVKVHNLAKFGGVIDSTVAAGGAAVRVNSIALTVEDSSKGQSDARALAMKAAITQAKELANAGGFAIGKPFFVTESGADAAQPPMAYVERASLKGADSASTSTPIQAGQFQVSVTIQAAFTIL